MRMVFLDDLVPSPAAHVHARDVRDVTSKGFEPLDRKIPLCGFQDPVSQRCESARGGEREEGGREWLVENDTSDGACKGL